MWCDDDDDDDGSFLFFFRSVIDRHAEHLSTNVQYSC